MAKLDFDAATPLYTSDATAWRVDQMSTVLDRFETNGQPSVIFVHGRGKEPNKSLRGGTFAKGLAVHKIALGYNVNVLLFNWDSAFRGFNLFDREVPLSHTDSAAQAFGDLLRALRQHASRKPTAPRLALLVHSMGSFVIQKCIQGARWPDGPPLFSNVLFSQPDCDDVGHADWLNTFAKKETVFITFNQDDHVLRRSTDARPQGMHALGLGTAEPLASSAKYVDLTLMGVLGGKDEDHEVFGKGAMNGEVFVCQFFEQVLSGKAVELDPARNVDSITRDVVYRLRSHRDPHAPCPKIPALPEF